MEAIPLCEHEASALSVSPSVRNHAIAVDPNTLHHFVT
jgi:hypothetical protein